MTRSKTKSALTGYLPRTFAARQVKKPGAQEMKALADMFNAERYKETETLARLMTTRYALHGFGWKILGAALKRMGRSAEALAAMQEAADLAPDDSGALSNLGVTLKDLGQFDEAIINFRKALNIKPDFFEVHSNLGNTLKDLCRLDEAVTSYRRAIQINPGYAEAHNNLGSALKNLRRFEEAAMSIKRALQIRPSYAEAHSNLGIVFQEGGPINKAEPSLRRALQIRPDYAETYYSLGVTLQRMGQLREAKGTYLMSLSIKPDSAEVYVNLGNILVNTGQLEKAIKSYRRASGIDPDFTEAQSNLLFTFNLLPNALPAEMLAAAQAYGQSVARKARPFNSWNTLPDPNRKLRIGLVSGDFVNHPVGFFIESILKALSDHAASRLEFIAYCCNSHTDKLTERVRGLCASWHAVLGLTDEALAEKIHDDKIDILIDLSGHTESNRLPVFAWRPSPIQVSWLGYFATTGLEAIDYIIADPWTLPDSESVYFTEKIWRLPETRLCLTPPDIYLQVSPLPALTNGYVTFGCFNNLAKMNDEVVSLWSRALALVPNSRLFLKAKQLSEDSARQDTVKRFAAYGIAADRLILEGFDYREAYLAAYHRVDIALDPFPYPGGTTSVEGLWMGVPVVTLAGERFLSRQGVGILMNAGLPEWVAADADDYVARTVSHATDLKCLSILRNKLRQQILTSPIMNAQRFAFHFEAALRNMWQINLKERHLEGDSAD